MSKYQIPKDTPKIKMWIANNFLRLFSDLYLWNILIYQGLALTNFWAVENKKRETPDKTDLGLRRKHFEKKIFL